MDVNNNKTLRLENVLIYTVFNMNTSQIGSIEEEPFSLELEVSKMDNEIRTKGARPVGPLIQYSNSKSEDESISMQMCFMLQADKYVNHLTPPYTMEPVILVTDCIYIRFIGLEEDIHYAYQKIEVYAYEREIILTGDSYTIFLDSSDKGMITADIFMSKKSWG